jgi:hypothetical protein
MKNICKKYGDVSLPQVGEGGICEALAKQMTDEDAYVAQTNFLQ